LFFDFHVPLWQRQTSNAMLATCSRRFWIFVGTLDSTQSSPSAKNKNCCNDEPHAASHSITLQYHHYSSCHLQEPQNDMPRSLPGPTQHLPSTKTVNTTTISSMTFKLHSAAMSASTLKHLSLRLMGLVLMASVPHISQKGLLARKSNTCMTKVLLRMRRRWSHRNQNTIITYLH